MNKINVQKDLSILNISFNQDNSCFTFGNEKGFKIYQSYPVKSPFTKEMGGGIKQVEMLYNSNFLALVGGGQSPKFSENELIIWDIQQDIIISQFKFKFSVINVKFKKDLIIAVCLQRIYVFNFDTYENICKIDTCENRKGLIGINGEPNFHIIGYPSMNSNKSITIKNLAKNKDISFEAHDDPISFMVINHDGKLIASANEKGTSIKIHCCINGNLIQEFKRGHEKVENIFLCFEKNSRMLAVTSSKGTIHLFYLGNTVKKLHELEAKINTNMEEDNIQQENDNITIHEPKNKKILFGLSKTEKSFAKYKIGAQRNICGFIGDNKVIILTYEFKYYLVEIDMVRGGNCKLILMNDLSKIQFDI